MRVVVTGSIAYDYLMKFPGHFHEHIVPEKARVLSVSFLVDELKKQCGGTAANIAYSMALLGLRPEVIGAVGEDFEDYRRRLDSCGVDTTHMVVVPGDFTSSCFINTDLINNQITAFYPGAMTHNHTLTLDGLGLDPDDIVLIAPNDPKAMAAYVQQCRRLGIGYLYDPSMQAPRLTAGELRDGFRGARILIGNDYEFGMIAEKLGIGESDLRALVPVSVITRGAEGSSIYADGREHRIPPAKTTAVINPTGAGDAFRSGLIVGMVKGLPWDVCGKLGATAAVYAVEQVGPQQHGYTKEDFLMRYQENFGDSDTPTL